MLSMEIHKDVMSYQPKVVAGLTSRTLGFTGLAIGSGVLVGIVEKVVLGLDPSAHVIPIMAASLPFWALGYTNPHGLKPETFALHWLRHKVLPQKLLYRTRPMPAALRNDIEAKEIRPDGTVRYAQALTPSYRSLRRRQGIEGWRVGEE